MKNNERPFWNCGKIACRCAFVLFFLILSQAVTLAAEGSGVNEPAVVKVEPKKLDMASFHEILTKIYTILAEYGLKIIGSLLIFIVGRWLSKLLSQIAGRSLSKAKMDETLVRFVQNLCYVGLITFVVIAALANVGIQTASFIAVLGAAGFAVGLALQGSLASFASGVLMLIFKPIHVGDYVEVAGATGTVMEVGIFTTALNSRDNTRITIPNSQITGNSIRNYTVNGTRRVDIVVGISYEDDLRKAQQVLERMLTSDKRVLSEPAPTVVVSDLGSSSVNFIVRPWVKPADYWSALHDLTAKVKLALDENNISIPYPQQDIHIKSGPIAGLTK